MMILRYFALLHLIATAVSSYKILLLPMNVNSHILYVGRMGHALSKLGHNVELLVPSNAKVPKDLINENFTITIYKVNSSEPFFNTKEASKIYLDYALSSNRFFAYFSLGYWFTHNSMDAMERDCESLLNEKELMIRLVKRSNFDFVISDFMVSECQYALTRILDVPYAMMSIPLVAWNIGVPRLSSFVPSMTFDYSDRMTFFERLSCFLCDMLIMTSFKLRAKPSKIPDYIQYKSSGEHCLLDFIRNASLLLYLEDDVIGYPRPTLPHVFSVGDVSAGWPRRPLPDEIDTFLSDSDALYLSFGSYFEYLTESLIEKFCSAIERLPHLKFVWRYKDVEVCSKEGKLSNLLTLPWVPQNDILADKRIKIFLTHGGFNSLMESVYHAKPVIVFPIAADQMNQAGSAVHKGYGIHMDLRYWQVDDLVKNINTILTNPSFTEKAKHFSQILSERPHPSAVYVSSAIHQVIKYGGEHLKSRASELYWFQFLMFDVALLLLLGIIGTVGLVLVCSCKLFRYFVRLQWKVKDKLKKL